MHEEIWRDRERSKFGKIKSLFFIEDLFYGGNGVYLIMYYAFFRLFQMEELELFIWDSVSIQIDNEDSTRSTGLDVLHPLWHKNGIAPVCTAEFAICRL